ncbi:MAG: proline--tRNA ligase, partial [Chloroflexota bacterium]
YRRVFQAYKNIFARCGLPAVPVEADSGAIGGKDSQEFMLLAESGEDEILRCSGCGYAANVERAAFVKPPAPREPERPLEKVATPGKKTIEEVAAFLGVRPEQTLKAVFYAADGKVVFVVIRGDLEVNEVKLKNALKCADLRLATDEEVRGAGLVAGYASPVGVTGVRVVGDDSIALGPNLVAGANLDGHHYKNTNYPRDFTVALLTDIARARAGYICARCGKAAFVSMRGIEVGHVFKLGTIFSEKLGASFLDKDGQKKPIIMGCYGIGVGRLLAAAVEQNPDDKGIAWPAPIAPYQVHMVGLQMDNPQVGPVAEKLYADLQAAGLDVLFDDRADSPGVKFNDADLLGIPLRVTISPRTLKTQSVELKRRMEAQARNAPLAEAVAAVRQAVEEASRAATGATSA